MRTTVRGFLSTASTSAVAAAALLSLSAHAQGSSADTFDIERFSNYGEGWFETFYVDETQALSAALEAGAVNADTKLLVTETAGGPLALLKDQMAFHHIAEGSVDGKDWMATF